MSDLNVTLDAMHEWVLTRGTLNEEAQISLLSAVQNVLALHVIGHDPGFFDICNHCGYSYPCPTMKALTDALEGGE